MIDLKTWRKAQGITQTQAADMLLITLRHYQRLEARQSPINARIAKLAAYVETSRLEARRLAGKQMD
jgi:transcriptional regulator with XRE-family HTH domain